MHKLIPLTTIRLDATTDDFDALWNIVNSRRASTQEVRVPVAALSRILIDHQRVCTRIQEQPQ